MNFFEASKLNKILNNLNDIDRKKFPLSLKPPLTHLPRMLTISEPRLPSRQPVRLVQRQTKFSAKMLANPRCKSLRSNFFLFQFHPILPGPRQSKQQTVGPIASAVHQAKIEKKMGHIKEGSVDKGENMVRHLDIRAGRAHKYPEPDKQKN